jgi:predicted CXXCH cytochrome family protein
MPNPTLEGLLVLQDRDVRRISLEAQLKAVPVDISLVEAAIAADRAAIEFAKTEVKELETKKKGIENEIGSAEAQLGKYKTQQMAVRKNDEYQALGHEIENVQKQIGELEGVELEVMYAIDEARKRFATAEAAMKQNIAGNEARIRMLHERGASLEAELGAARGEVTSARGPVPEAMLQIYDRMSGRGMPVVVPVRDGKCGGCHLKISSETESAIRGKAKAAEPALCDQCGRIVYLDS